MRKSSALISALCGTFVIILLFAAGRMLFIKFYKQSFEDITDTASPQSISLSENDISLGTITDGEQLANYIDLLGSHTYVPYPHLIQPNANKLRANHLTVTFENGNSISVNADGYVFINDKLRDIKNGQGKTFYHDLYLLFYPNAA